MNIHFIVHESFEAPGAYIEWADKNGYEKTFSRVYNEEPLPVSADNIDLLVVLGGPQSPATTKAECKHFDAVAECDLIKKCIDAKKAVVGICLGSQLIGEALGAPHSQSPQKEIGKFPINLTEYGAGHDKFHDFGDSIEVGHWHNDMPGLTDDAKIIAFSEGCPRQIVEYTDLVYGFQCHMEFTPEVIELLIEAETALPSWSNHRFVQQADVLRKHDYSHMNQKLFSFLDRLVDAYRRS